MSFFVSFRKHEFIVKNYYLSVDAKNVAKTQYIRIGTNDKIVVDVVGVPQPTFKWKRDGITINLNTGRYSQSSKGTVSIKDVRIGDKGNYTLTIDQESRSLEMKIEVIAFGK